MASTLLNDLRMKALKAAIGPAAAVMVESIQGEGGIREVPAETLRALRQICDEHDLLLIFDEVQTGMGRTGNCSPTNGQRDAPDIIAMAKEPGRRLPVAGIPGEQACRFGHHPAPLAPPSAATCWR